MGVYVSVGVGVTVGVMVGVFVGVGVCVGVNVGGKGGNRIICPASIRSPSIQLARRVCPRVVPARWDKANRVSPRWTM